MQNTSMAVQRVKDRSTSMHDIACNLHVLKTYVQLDAHANSICTQIKPLMIRV